MVSCYLRLTPEERESRRYLTTLKSRIHALKEEAVGADLSRILESVTSPNALPHAAGLAIFACEALGLFEVMPLPRVVRTRLMVDDTPHILELIAVQEELGTILAAVIDRSHARFFLAGVGVATELEGLIDPARRGGSFHGDRQDAPGWGERDYHNRLREERHRHCAAIARHLQYLTRLHPTRGLMLAGPRRETTALEPFLSRELAGRILGMAALNPTAVGAAEVQAAALAVADAHQRQAELGLVASLAESIGTGWAVDGPASRPFARSPAARPAPCWWARTSSCRDSAAARTAGWSSRRGLPRGRNPVPGAGHR